MTDVKNHAPGATNPPPATKPKVEARPPLTQATGTHVVFDNKGVVYVASKHQVYMDSAGNIIMLKTNGSIELARCMPTFVGILFADDVKDIMVEAINLHAKYLNAKGQKK